MRGKTIVCVMGSLGLLLGAGAAWGNQQMDTTGSGSDTSAAPSRVAVRHPHRSRASQNAATRA